MGKIKLEVRLFLYVLVILALCWLSAAAFAIFPWTDDQLKWWYFPQIFTIIFVDGAVLYAAWELLQCEKNGEEASK